MAHPTYRSRTLTMLLLALTSFLSPAAADDSSVDETKYIYGTDASGVTRSLAVNRQPALYTGDFSDCLGGQSLFNVTKFDAAYYADNLTVVIHLDGVTSVKNESLMLHIEVDAYGENRFEMNFDPCSANIYSLCPLNASVPVTAWAVIQVAPSQVADIPSIAFSIPDFEGSARLQLFANSSRSEIGCFQAVMRNGASFSLSGAIGAILGIFTLAAIASSFATTLYGVSIEHMRTHYAHSLSALAILETFQSVFLSGALNVDWPSVLPAWRSNFAWAAGLVDSGQMLDSLGGFDGIHGNGSQVGGAGSAIINAEGGLAQQIYGRALAAIGSHGLTRRVTAPSYAYNASDPYDYTWAGYPARPGMPMPGTWTGFAGTLVDVGMPAADAFMVGFIWLLVALGLVATCVTALKFLLDVLARRKRIREDRLLYFRSHLTGYLGLALLRTLLIAFFAATTLALLQFNLHAGAGPTALAALVFVFFLVGIGGVVAYALYFRLRHGRYRVETGPVALEKGRLFGAPPSRRLSKAGKRKAGYGKDDGKKDNEKKEEEKKEEEGAEGAPKPLATLQLVKVSFVDDDPGRAQVHQDEAYVKRFGWLSARYRRTRWWFFACWLGYQLLRALFLGGASGSPLAQVFGYFVVEVFAFVLFVRLRPFEGSRNASLAVWMLGISKVVTAGLSIAFLPAFDLDRILAAVLGFIIIIVQGFVVIAIMILIGLGTVSSWMSLTRNREQFPEKLDGLRIRYFEHLQETAPDLPKTRAEKAAGKSAKAKGKEVADEEVPQKPREPYFSVNSVRRAPKIEDEDEDVEEAAAEEGYEDMAAVGSSSHPTSGYTVPAPNRASRAGSVSSRHSASSLPRAARTHRNSWSSRDFSAWQDQLDRPDSALSQRMSGSHLHSRSNSLRIQHLRSLGSLGSLGDGLPAPRLDHKGSAPLLGRLMTPTEEKGEDFGGEERPATAGALMALEGKRPDGRPTEEDTHSEAKVSEESHPEEKGSEEKLPAEDAAPASARRSEESPGSEETSKPEAALAQA